MDWEDQKSSKPVPRFGSFRPHALPTHVSKPGETSKIDRNSSSSLHHGVSKRHHRSSERPSHSLKVRPDSDTSSKPEHDLVPWDDSPVLFDIDVKGDARNIEYKSSYGAPVYPQLGHDRALGLKTFWGSGVHRASVVDRGKTSLSKQIRSDLKTTRILRVNPRASSGLRDDAGADFVPLQLLKGRKRKLQDHTISQSSPKSPESRHQASLDDGSDSASAPDATLENTSDQSTLEDNGAHTPKLLEGLQRKRAALSNRVDEAPSDWHAWMALVELQDEIDGFPDAFSQRPHTNAERQINAEIALSMYGKALKCVIDPAGREQLHLGMMSKASIVWETRKLSSHWQTIIKQHPLSLRVWKEYLNFHQSMSSGFSVEENKNRYIDCLNVLQGVRNDMESSDARRSAVYGIQIHVLLRLTLLLREAGYTEVAVASWQALIEFEFNKPTQFQSLDRTAKSTYDDSILAFENFWDSEVARIGEPNAKGWLNSDDADLEESQPPKGEGIPSHSGMNGFKSWADAEYQAYCCSKLPSRVIDEPLDDPYKTVLFSDVRHALIESPTDLDNHAIIAAFLCFCHLPPCPENARGQIQTWYEDQFVRNQILYDRPVLSRSHGSVLADSHDPHGNRSTTTVKTADPSLPSVFAFPLGNYEISSDALCTPPGQWFSAFGSRTEPIPKDFILRTLNILVSRGVGGDSLTEYLLAFEEHVSPSTVRKSAKNLLKNRTSSLRLYNAYALLESRHGNTEAANKVWDTAIKMSAKFEDSARRDAILLWRSRVWQHLSLGETSKALQQLSGYGSGNTVDETSDGNGKLSDKATTTVRLRLRNAFSAGRDHMLSLGLMTHAALYSELLFLSDYLLNTSIQAAHASFTSSLQLLTKNKDPNRNRRAEALFRQSFARLLYTHTTHKRPISPSTIRSFLTESIAAFPHNTIFLSLYAWNESRFRIDDRVRGIMRDVVFSNSNQHTNNNKPENEDIPSDHITTHFFAIHTDIQRGPIQGSNLSAVRGTFERALSSHSSAAHSAGLWKWYFLYELENSSSDGNGNLKRAREVYYRAIGACPWAKGIYMLAFEYLSEGMEERELRGVYEMMVERELRIHVAL
ncbi:MAG: hypothetical protein L6R38_003435 [Xanthoria sp. 2 TBL-2021]|nr:MAG: hypothetical protein L6R38_003435 [Xanthoria sp. 2 TBL-2021]